MEGRALGEAAFTLGMIPWIQAHAPSGDGRPVLVLPGFGCASGSTALLRTLIARQGYAVRDWEQGRNLGPCKEMEQRLVSIIEEMVAQHAQPVSLVGWSLGGLYARALANDHPQLVRQVITLGSPHLSRPENSVIKDLFDRVSPTKGADLTESDYERIRRTPSVPVTSIYTKTDGIVSWQDCINEELPHTANIEVTGSHSGLSHNYQAILAILRQLAV
jgi:predicted esterase YcpF (UPF0227 family)